MASSRILGDESLAHGDAATEARAALARAECAIANTERRTTEEEEGGGAEGE
jgi:hypothetical protein